MRAHWFSHESDGGIAELNVGRVANVVIPCIHAAAVDGPGMPSLDAYRGKPCSTMRIALVLAEHRCVSSPLVRTRHHAVISPLKNRPIGQRKESRLTLHEGHNLRLRHVEAYASPTSQSHSLIPSRDARGQTLD